MKQHRIETKKAAGQVSVDDDGVIISTPSAWKDFEGQKLIRLTEWLSQQDGEPVKAQEL